MYYICFTYKPEVRKCLHMYNLKLVDRWITELIRDFGHIAQATEGDPYQVARRIVELVPDTLKNYNSVALLVPHDTTQETPQTLKELFYFIQGKL